MTRLPSFTFGWAGDAAIITETYPHPLPTHPPPTLAHTPASEVDLVVPSVTVGPNALARNPAGAAAEAPEPVELVAADADRVVTGSVTIQPNRVVADSVSTQPDRLIGNPVEGAGVAAEATGPADLEALFSPATNPLNP